MPDVRLIDANALPMYKVKIVHSFGIVEGSVVFPDDIQKAPTIDAVPVMRCWECDQYTPTICHRVGTVVKPFDYCSYGKPKMDGGAEG